VYGTLGKGAEAIGVFAKVKTSIPVTLSGEISGQGIAFELDPGSGDGSHSNTHLVLAHHFEMSFWQPIQQGHTEYSRLAQSLQGFKIQLGRAMMMRVHSIRLPGAVTVFGRHLV
jgi:hypothetical protein